MAIVGIIIVNDPGQDSGRAIEKARKRMSSHGMLWDRPSDPRSWVL